jgi:hypothetical protein
MTLILNSISRDSVVQVSDRCITWGNAKVAPHDRNKVVLFGPVVAFSYTGTAKIQDIWTDLWLARELKTLPNMNVFQAIATIRPKGNRCIQKAHHP